MVKWLSFFLIPLWISADISISTLLDQDEYYENQPITGVLQLTVPQNAKVDENSFLKGKEPLKVVMERSVPFPGPDGVKVVSYRFKEPGEKKGLKMFPAVSVLVDGKRVQSISVSYEVKGALPINPDKSKFFLKIENLIEAPKDLYPGQKITLGYRYLYEGAIDLDQEVLPMVDQVPFKRLGEKIIEDSSEGSTSVRVVKQFMQIEKEGDYSFPSAKVRGYAYQMTPYGSKVYLQPALESTTKPVTLSVKPFPEEGKPPFFNGAIGPFEMHASADLPPILTLDDRLNLKLKFSGDGVINTLKPPLLGCIPGFIGNFELSDLPPEGSEKEGHKTFNYELKVKTPWTDQIPPLYFAYFDPPSATYKIIKTDPLVIKVEADRLKKESVEIQKISPQAKLATDQDLGRPPAFIKPVKILSSPWMLIFLPLLAFLRSRPKKVRSKTKEDLIQEALQASTVEDFSSLASQVLDKNNPFLRRIDAIRYGNDRTPLTTLKADFGKLFVFFLIGFLPLYGTFYETEERLNVKLEKSLEDARDADSAFYLEALNRPVEALYYYEKASSLNPWNQEIKQKLTELKRKNSFNVSDRFIIDPIPWLITFFSLVMIVSILFKSKLLYLFSAGLFGVILILHFLLPIHALMVEGDALKIAPYPEAPTLAKIERGEIVDVIGEAEEGKYLKIKDKEGKIGFISFEKIRIF